MVSRPHTIKQSLTGRDVPPISENKTAPDHPARLVAYLTTNGKALPPTEELIGFLKQRLPDYMIPSAFVPVNEIPRTPNGKIDRAALAGLAPATEEKTPRKTSTSDPLEQALTALWSDVLQTEAIGPNDDFFEHGGHSLIAMRLFANIRKEFGTALPLATLFATPTIRLMAQLLRRLPKTDTLRAPLVAIQPNGARRPVFLIHGVGGDVLCFQLLARHLGEDQPFYGLQAKGIDNRDNPDTTVEQMASRYIKAIRVVSPEGPYILGGFSSGGTIAFEMARQLRDAGRQVDHLIILENMPPNVVNAPPIWHPRAWLRIAQNIPFWVYEDLLHSHPLKTWRRSISKLRLIGDRLRRGPGQRTAHLAGADIKDFLGISNVSDHHHHFLQTHYRALLAYTPKPMDIRMTLFRSHTRPLLSRTDSDLGWTQVGTRGVDVRVLPGSHDSMLRLPHVRQLATQLNQLFLSEKINPRPQRT